MGRMYGKNGIEEFLIVHGFHHVAKLTKKRSVKGLIRVLSSRRNFYVRAKAALSLGKLEDPRAVEPLIAALNYNSVDDAAATALGQLKDPRAVEPLIQALIRSREPNNEPLRHAAIQALGELLDTRAAIHVIEELKDRSAKIRCSAAVTLGRLKDLRAAEPLIAAMQDESADVSKAALTALSQLNYPRITEVVINALRNKFLAELAATILGKLKDPRAVQPLIEALVYRNGEVQRAAAYSLRLLGEPHWTKLVMGENFGDYERLAKTRDPRIIEPLIRVLRENEIPYDYLFEALSDMKTPEAISLLIEKLKGTGYGLGRKKKIALELLNQMKNNEGKTPLTSEAIAVLTSPHWETSGGWYGDSGDGISVGGSSFDGVGMTLEEIQAIIGDF